MTKEEIHKLVNTFLTETEQGLVNNYSLTTEDHLTIVVLRRFMSNKMIVDNSAKREAIRDRLRELGEECVRSIVLYIAKNDPDRKDKGLQNIEQRARDASAYIIESWVTVKIHDDKWG